MLFVLTTLYSCTPRFRSHVTQGSSTALRAESALGVFLTSHFTKTQVSTFPVTGC